MGSAPRSLSNPRLIRDCRPRQFSLQTLDQLRTLPTPNRSVARGNLYKQGRGQDNWLSPWGGRPDLYRHVGPGSFCSLHNRGAI